MKARIRLYNPKETAVVAHKKKKAPEPPSSLSIRANELMEYAHKRLLAKGGVIYWDDVVNESHVIALEEIAQSVSHNLQN